jgi:hypothetical protein
MGSKGLYFDRQRNKWRAEIYVNGMRYQSKRFNTKKEARNARREMEINAKLGNEIQKNEKSKTPEIVAFIKNRREEATCIADLVLLINKHFDTDLTYKQVRAIMYYNRLCSKKKGNHTDKPLFSEIINVRGDVMIKIKNNGTQAQNWKKKSIWLWEQENGKLPECYKIIFLDKNKSNCVIENLACVPEAVIGCMVRNNLYFTDAEFTKTGIAIARHKIAINKAIKRQAEGV